MVVTFQDQSESFIYSNVIGGKLDSVIGQNKQVSIHNQRRLSFQITKPPGSPNLLVPIENASISLFFVITDTIMPALYSIASYIMVGLLSLLLVEHLELPLNYWTTHKKMPNGLSVSIFIYFLFKPSKLLPPCPVFSMIMISLKQDASL